MSASSGGDSALRSTLSRSKGGNHWSRVEKGAAFTCSVELPAPTSEDATAKKIVVVELEREVVIYSYSMRQHFADQHPTAMIPEDVESHISDHPFVP